MSRRQLVLVAAENANKVLAAEEQQVIQALPADRPDPPLGDRVGASGRTAAGISLHLRSARRSAARDGAKQRGRQVTAEAVGRPFAQVTGNDQGQLGMGGDPRGDTARTVAPVGESAVMPLTPVDAAGRSPTRPSSALVASTHSSARAARRRPAPAPGPSWPRPCACRGAAPCPGCRAMMVGGAWVG